MNGATLAPWVVPATIATCTVIVVPVLVTAGKHWWKVWRVWRRHKLAEHFATREEVEMQFQELHKAQNAQHAENKSLLDTIRAEGQLREGRLLGTLEAAHAQRREDTKDVRAEVQAITTRIDSLLGMMGNRRKQ